jgi:hypothetical protein
VLDRLAHGQMRVEAAALQHDADPRAQLLRPLLGIESEHRHVARAACAIALEDLHRRRLAGAVGPEQPVHLAARHLERDAAERLEPS